MSSEMKLILQNSVNVNASKGNFKLNLTGNNLEGKRELFLVENDDFMINSITTFYMDTINTTDQQKMLAS